MRCRLPHAQFVRHGYHHGNLREALIAAARRLIAEHGPQGFTLNEASRTAGVSPSAPYRHFRDRNALIEATAEEGFNLFRERLLAATAGVASPYEALHRMGAAYYAFALDEPGFYQAMFSSGLPTVGTSVTQAGDRAFPGLRADGVDHQREQQEVGGDLFVAETAAHRELQRDEANQHEDVAILVGAPHGTVPIPYAPRKSSRAPMSIIT